MDKQPSYRKRRIRRATTDTIGPLGKNTRTASYALQVAVVGLIYVLIFLGKDEARAELEIAFAGLLALITVFSLNFIWNYIEAPARMQREADSAIDELRRSIEEKYFATKAIFETRDDDKRIKVQIEVSNPTNKTIRNVAIAIDSIEALSNNEYFERHGQKLLGHFFELNGPIDRSSPSKYLVDLHPKQSATFNIVDVNIVPANDVFKFIHDRKQADGQGRYHYFKTGESSIPAGNYKVGTVVRGEDAVPERVTFILESTETETNAVQIDVARRKHLSPEDTRKIGKLKQFHKTTPFQR